MRITIAPLFFALYASTTYAVDAGIVSSGASGALSTPTAHVLPLGQFAFSYAPQLDSAEGGQIANTGHNFLLGAGAFPYTETFVRLATSELNTDCFSEGCGDTRDLSASTKIQLPLKWLSNDANNPYLFSFGLEDIGGAATNFRKAYVVATYDKPNYAISAGYARAEAGRSRSNVPVQQFFASAIYQPKPWFQALVETSGKGSDVGIRLLTPRGLLPHGVQLQSEYRTRNIAQVPEGQDDTVWSVSVNWPLGFFKSDAEREAVEPPGQFKLIPRRAKSLLSAAEASAASPAELPVLAPEFSLLSDQLDPDTLANKLYSLGFQDISIAQTAERWVIRIENQAYNWSDLDAFGAALAAYAGWSKAQPAAVQIQLTRERLVVQAIESDTLCLLTWHQGTSACTAPFSRAQIYDNPTQWAIKDVHRSVWRPRLEVGPVFNYFLGTEFGTLDFNPALGLELFVPTIIPGQVVSVNYLTGLYESSDFRDGVFSGSAVQSAFVRTLLHQYMVLPGGFSAHLAVGRQQIDFDGGFGELRWQSGNGRHRWLVHGGSFENSDGVQGKPLLLSYRYQLPNSPVALGARYGEFFFGDVGFTAFGELRQGSATVTAFVRRTTGPNFANPDESVTVAGVQASFPLTPRRSRPTRFGQVRGAGDVFVPIITEINNPVNRIFFNPSRGVGSSVANSLDFRLFDRDRNGTLEGAALRSRVGAAFTDYALEAGLNSQDWARLPPASLMAVNSAVDLLALRETTLSSLHRLADYWQARDARLANTLSALRHQVSHWPLRFDRQHAQPNASPPPLVGMFLNVPAPQSEWVVSLAKGAYDQRGANQRGIWVLQSTGELAHLAWPASEMAQEKPPRDIRAIYSGIDPSVLSEDTQSLNQQLLTLLQFYQPS